MFKSGQPNPYDDLINKATDENQTSENWEIILNICDKAQEDGDQGARNVMAAILRRLSHRNPNVQLYTLAVVEALSKNCTIDVHREIASRAFTQGLEKIVTDRTTHEKVRQRTLSLVAMWTAEFEKDPTLGIMEECYESLKAKNYKFETPQEPAPPEVDDEVRRREEEELQRVLEMSMHDKGGRGQWLSTYADPTEASGSGSSSAPIQADPAPASSWTQSNYPAPSAQVPSSPVPTSAAPSGGYTATAASPVQQARPISSNSVTRVRALHTFESSDKGELAFEKGDIIKVVDRNYKDWWRGQLKGRTGIFPVNYVEILPEPTPAELAKEAEQEVNLFAQAASIDKLLNMLRGLDPHKDNLADNEEIQELYRSSMALRPKIVKLIDKYSQKRAELVMMNDSFVKARTIFDRMMEESLARHSGFYEARPGYSQHAQVQARPDSRAYAASGYGPFSPSAYGAYPQTATGYQPAAEGMYGNAQPAPQPYVDPNVIYGPQQSPYVQPQPIQSTPGSYNQPSQMPADYMQPQPQAQPPTQTYHQPQPQSQAAVQQDGKPAETMNQNQAQAQAQAPQGPPYVFDPNTTYSDPNVQAWAQYYAQGGKDPAGTVYFFSVPGVTDIQSQAPPATSQIQNQHPSQQQQQPQGQGEMGAVVQNQSQPYQGYPAQQSAGELTNPEGYFPAQNGSASSLPSAGYGEQNGAPPAHSQPAGSPQGVYAAPTSPLQRHQSFYSPLPEAQQQHRISTAYPAGGGYFPSQSQNGPSSPSATTTPGFDSHYVPPHQQQQFAQMQTQFGGMGIDDRNPPGPGVAPAAQTA